MPAVVKDCTPYGPEIVFHRSSVAYVEILPAAVLRYFQTCFAPAVVSSASVTFAVALVRSQVCWGSGMMWLSWLASIQSELYALSNVIVKCVSSTAVNEVQSSGALPSEYEPHWSLFALIRLNQNSTSRLVIGLPSDQCRSPRVIVTLLLSGAKSAAVATEPALSHPILPVDPS